MEKVKFVIKTAMEKEDYKKFLYVATFFRNKMIIPMILLISLAGGVFISISLESFNVFTILISWVLLFILAVAVICFKVEYRNRLRIKTDNTGTFGSVSILSFYEDNMIMENEILKSKSEMEYKKFYEVLESKDFWIFYFTANQAYLIRKKDVEELESFKEFLKGIFKDKYKRI